MKIDIEMLTSLTTEIVSAHVSNNSVSVTDLPALIQGVFTSLSNLRVAEENTNATPAFLPATSVRKSLSGRDKIISMIDGKPYSMLKRHLGQHGLTPDGYRQRYHLPYDYPMTAPGYAAQRSALAKKIGLGRKKGHKVEAAALAGKDNTEEANAKPKKPRVPKATPAE